MDLEQYSSQPTKCLFNYLQLRRS